MKKIVLSTGGFDPVHSGHISYLKASREQGDLLIVGVNSDDWLIRKKGQYFLPIKERMSILESFKFVEKVIEFDDSDNSACDAILKVRHLYPDYKIIFANGGDRNEKNILESKICDRNLEFKFGIGGVEKLNSSSKILENWKNMTVEKPWGKYKLLLNIFNVVSFSFIALRCCTIYTSYCLICSLSKFSLSMMIDFGSLLILGPLKNIKSKMLLDINNPIIIVVRNLDLFII
jgi:D-beta-D-heptose 7-phosphate kinase/D-beta-D-heptose 1-phosphate adenosyltransferase